MIQPCSQSSNSSLNVLFLRRTDTVCCEVFSCLNSWETTFTMQLNFCCNLLSKLQIHEWHATYVYCWRYDHFYRFFFEDLGLVPEVAETRKTNKNLTSWSKKRIFIFLHFRRFWNNFATLWLLKWLNCARSARIGATKESWFTSLQNACLHSLKLLIHGLLPLLPTSLEEASDFYLEWIMIPAYNALCLTLNNQCLYG